MYESDMSKSAKITQSGRVVKATRDNNFVYGSTLTKNNAASICGAPSVSGKKHDTTAGTLLGTQTSVSGERCKPDDATVGMLGTLTASYALNQERALEKKIEACDRTPVEAEHTDTNSIITCSTLAFELFREYMDNFCNTEGLKTIATQKTDCRGFIESDTLKVFQINNPLKSEHLFTMTLYRTTCRVLVNGPGLGDFQEEQYPDLEEKILNMYNPGKEDYIKHSLMKLLTAQPDRKTIDDKNASSVGLDLANETEEKASVVTTHHKGSTSIVQEQVEKEPEPENSPHKNSTNIIEEDIETNDKSGRAEVSLRILQEEVEKEPEPESSPHKNNTSAGKKDTETNNKLQRPGVSHQGDSKEVAPSEQNVKEIPELDDATKKADAYDAHQDSSCNDLKDKTKEPSTFDMQGLLQDLQSELSGVIEAQYRQADKLQRDLLQRDIDDLNKIIKENNKKYAEKSQEKDKIIESLKQQIITKDRELEALSSSNEVLVNALEQASKQSPICTDTNHLAGERRIQILEKQLSECKEETEQLQQMCGDRAMQVWRPSRYVKPYK